MKRLSLPTNTFSLDTMVADWLQSIGQKHYQSAKTEAKNKINQLKSSLKNDVSKLTEDESNLNYILAIFFRGLYDFTKLQELTNTSHWEKDNKLIERVWNCIWDCSDRLEFCLPNIEGPMCDKIIMRIDELTNFYHEQYGPGLYCSPDILVKKQTCTICGRDFRECDHIAGRLYRGKMCRPKVEDFELRSTSIVKVPQDPRCRIWPWNLKNDRTFTAAIMTLHMIDDFMTEDNWE